MTYGPHDPATAPTDVMVWSPGPAAHEYPTPIAPGVLAVREYVNDLASSGVTG